MASFKLAIQAVRFYCSQRTPLVGRDIIDLQELYHNDLKSIIWTALDLKLKMKEETAHLLKGRHVTFLLDSTQPFAQAVTGRAVSSLGGGLTTVIEKSLENLDKKSLEDLGRDLSATSDVILIYSGNQCLISKFADAATIPTVAFRSEKFAILQALSDTMTMYEHFNVLSLLTLSWVGPPTALFNSYLCLMPQMKANFRFCCNDSDTRCQTSPAMMNVGIRNSIANKTEFHECANPAEAVNRTDVIVTTGHDIPSLSLKKKDVSEASVNHILLHDLPRGKSEISEEVFRSQHSAVWKSRENVAWITMAVLMQLTHDYKPTISQPKWERE